MRGWTSCAWPGAWCGRGCGASFFDELQEASHLLRTELEDALSELVATGLVNSDSFAGLRGLLTPSSKRDAHARRLRRPALFTTLDSAGRWALLRNLAAGADAAPMSHEERDAAVEHVARVLLRRHGVVCWRLLEREAAWLPPWRQLLRVYHRLEARGEIRGGRFIAGLSGEQFALPEAIAPLRAVRKRPAAGEELDLAATDPLNLAGLLWPGTRVPRTPGNRLRLREGLPEAGPAATATAVAESA